MPGCRLLLLLPLLPLEQPLLHVLLPLVHVCRCLHLHLHLLCGMCLTYALYLFQVMAPLLDTNHELNWHANMVDVIEHNQRTEGGASTHLLAYSLSLSPWLSLLFLSV